jgi:2-oxoisovalerate dehydrogenase E1 component alpha subunit
VYPGGRKIAYSPTLDMHPPSATESMPMFRVMNEDGSLRPGAPSSPLFDDRDTVRAWYSAMLRVQEMDRVFYDAQRQGRISFYMQNAGEEGVQIGSGSALARDDEIFAQYREAGVLMWRGFTLQMFADQCFSNADDPGKGRQMPVHYGSAALHVHTISSPLATQIPQAAGAAYALKLEGAWLGWAGGARGSGRRLRPLTLSLSLSQSLSLVILAQARAAP